MQKKSKKLSKAIVILYRVRYNENVVKEQKKKPAERQGGIKNEYYSMTKIKNSPLYTVLLYTCKEDNKKERQEVRNHEKRTRTKIL